MLRENDGREDNLTGEKMSVEKKMIVMERMY